MTYLREIEDEVEELRRRNVSMSRAMLRIAALELEVQALRAEVAELRVIVEAP